MLFRSHCSNTTINIAVPAKIDTSELFKYDLNSDYYKDKCLSYTTEDGTDIILSDKLNEYKNNNMSLCESTCSYSGYDVDNQQSGCICQVKNQMEAISDIIDKPDKLASPNISKEESSSGSSNLLSLECSKALFSKEGLQKNISSYIIIGIIIYHLFSVLSFLKCGFPLLRMEMNKILKSKEKNTSNNINKKQTESKVNKYNKFKFSNKKNPPIKGKVRFFTNDEPYKRYHTLLKSNLNSIDSRNRIFSLDNNKNKNEIPLNNIHTQVRQTISHRT